MDITDIFDELPGDTDKASAKGIAESLGLDTHRPNQEILHSASLAARLHDQAVSIAADLKTTKAALIAEVNTKLQPLTEKLQAANKAAQEAKDKLERQMHEASLNFVEMPDRKPIQFKTTPGKKKGITLKWLKSHLEDTQAAKELWEAQPKGEATTTLVIPPPSRDEPTR